MRGQFNQGAGRLHGNEEVQELLSDPETIEEKQVFGPFRKALSGIAKPTQIQPTQDIKYRRLAGDAA
jgi:hypothetical protein